MIGDDKGDYNEERQEDGEEKLYLIDTGSDEPDDENIPLSCRGKIMNTAIFDLFHLFDYLSFYFNLITILW